MASRSKTTMMKEHGSDPVARRQRSSRGASVTNAREGATGESLAGIKLAPTTRRTSIRPNAPGGIRKRQSSDRDRDGRRSERTSRQFVSGSGQTISTDSTSGGRSGRQFTVGNVGNNGMIYLRPVIRPANERHQTPSFVFPPTPEDEKPKAVQPERKSYFEQTATQRDSVWSSTLPSNHTTRLLRQSVEHNWTAGGPPSVLGSRLHRAHSFSTVEEYNGTKDRESAALKVLSGEDRRPRSADTNLPFFLPVSIPHYRLGIPRFSTRGTAILRSSAYTRASSEDLHSSAVLSGDNIDNIFPQLPGVDAHDFISNWNSNAQAVSNGKGNARPVSPPIQRSLVPIRSKMYDDLTFAPGANSPKVVRFSPTTGQVVAATVPRIIAQITSANFLDYDLLSDFFLTFRSFMTCHDLVGYLLTRLQWAIYHGGDVGSIVRVRAFVAVRHWILNYFVDDFVPNMELRRLFADMLNALTQNIQHRPNGASNDLNLIGEVKKCWRRTCALYWDGPHFTGDGRADEPLCPGGFAGTRADGCHPSTNHLRTSVSGSVDSQLAPLVQYPPTEDGGSLMQEVTRAGHFDMPWPHMSGADASEIVRQEAERQLGTIDERGTTPNSESSSTAQSCSLPGLALFKPDPQNSRSQGPHPILAKSNPMAGKTEDSEPIGAPSSSAHIRSISCNDAVEGRRARPPSPKKATAPVVDKPTMSIPYPGSLVRGTVVPPPEAFVGAIAPRTPADAIRTPHMRSARAHASAVTTQQRAGGQPQPSVRRWLEHMRRVFSSKMIDTGALGSSSNKPGSSGPHSEARPSGDAEVHPAYRRQPAIRIDLLGASAMESFNELMKDSVNAQKDVETTEGIVENAAGFDFDLHTKGATGSRMPSGISTSSDSIVIVDDTKPPPIPGAMLGMATTKMNTTAHSPQLGDLVASKTPSPDPGHLFTYRPPAEPQRTSAVTSNPDFSGRAELVPIVAEVEVKEYRDSLECDSIVTLQSQFPSPPQQQTRPSRGDSLRKYASYQSGLAKFAADQEQHLGGKQDVDTVLSSETPGAVAGRLLRRRPGGDLRAAENVTDLQHVQRPKSVGSITTYSESITSSLFQRRSGGDRVVTGDFTQKPHQTLSLGAFGRRAPQNSKSAAPGPTSTHPALRQSFEVEVAKLAQIPDDDDDGGIESTLLKLEGKFEKRNSDSTLGQSSVGYSHLSMEDDEDEDDLLDNPNADHPREKKKNRHKQVLESILSAAPGGPSEQVQEESQASALTPSKLKPRPAMKHENSGESGASYSSIPLLDRALSDDSLSDRHTSPDRYGAPMPKALFSNSHSQEIDERESYPSILHAEENESELRLREEATGTHKDVVSDSFLLDEDEDFSDLSSEISSDDYISDTELTSPKSPTFSHHDHLANIADLGLGPHPLRHPPSPPRAIDEVVTSNGAKAISQNKPPSPASTPKNNTSDKTFGPHSQQTSVSTVKAPEQNVTAQSKADPAHLPFVLAHDSETLAQQLTLIEKDALNEIDWKELVELKWKHNPPSVKNWVEYLRTTQPKGLELVIARFNLVVTWAVSEVLLTMDTHERAATIVKYIHIAAHARRLRNYATMCQITIAMVGSDISRLAKTWELVPKADTQTLRELETLVTPTRNFNNLRIEMDAAAIEEGCIPFVGVYTHDLIFNAQRPAQMIVSLKEEPLINFERFRVTASIVKDLLRLLEASSKYNIKPVDGVLERCLWLATLSDAEIRACGKELQ